MADEKAEPFDTDPDDLAARLSGASRTGWKAMEFGRKQAMKKAAVLIKIAACRAFKITQREQAALLGLTPRSIEHYIEKERAYVDELAEFIRSVTPALDVTPVEDIADEGQYVAVLRQRLGALVSVLDKALASRDLKVAMNAAIEINKVLGFTTKQKVEHTGKIEHEHTHRVIPPSLLPVINGPRIRRGLEPLKLDE